VQADTISSLLNQFEEVTLNNLSNLDPQLKLEIALQLLKIVDSVHMGNGLDQNKLYKEAEKIGIHIQRPHFYSPLPILSQLPEYIWDKKWNEGIDWNDSEGLRLIQRLIKYSSEYNYIIDSNQYDIINQNSFTHLDSALYYAIIRHFKPDRIIEVGAGYSTIIATLACSKNTCGEIVAVEPYPTELLKNSIARSTIAVQLVQKPVQIIPAAVFKQLHENDILFIDSTHVSKIGSDVNYLLLEVLPQLEKGVLIHIHDIFLPLELPRDWIERLHLFWNEQYLVHALLIGSRDFEILIGNCYMVLHHPEKIAALYDRNNKYNELKGGSLWIRKKS
jgi:predicted O-methyltransferase YrrM